MIKPKILSSCAVLIVTTSAIAGGDPRDFGPVESFDSINISNDKIIEQEAVIGKTPLGTVITGQVHNTCKYKLNLSKGNIARFKEALSGGYLYNVGPFDALGTLFSPNRWNDYFDCVEKHEVPK